MTFYETRFMRAHDLTGHEIVRIRGVWRELLDVWHPGDDPGATLGADHRLAARIADRITVAGSRWVVLRYVVPQHVDSADLVDDLWPLSRHDLVEVQVPARPDTGVPRVARAVDSPPHLALAGLGNRGPSGTPACALNEAMLTAWLRSPTLDDPASTRADELGIPTSRFDAETGHYLAIINRLLHQTPPGLSLRNDVIGITLYSPDADPNSGHALLAIDLELEGSGAVRLLRELRRDDLTAETDDAADSDAAAGGVSGAVAVVTALANLAGLVTSTVAAFEKVRATASGPTSTTDSAPADQPNHRSGYVGDVAQWDEFPAASSYAEMPGALRPVLQRALYVAAKRASTAFAHLCCIEAALAVRAEFPDAARLQFTIADGHPDEAVVSLLAVHDRAGQPRWHRNDGTEWTNEELIAYHLAAASEWTGSAQFQPVADRHRHYELDLDAVLGTTPGDDTSHGEPSTPPHTL